MSNHPTEPTCARAGGQDTARWELRWDLRIARARELAAQCPSATQILTFYGGLAEYQRSLCCRPIRVRSTTCDFSAGPKGPALLDSVDLDAASAAVPDFLVWLQHTAPARLASVRTGTCSLTLAEWRELMRRSLIQHDDDITGVDETMAFVVEALVQPFAEAAAIDRREGLGLHPNKSGALPSRCPICSGRPCLGILREEGQGAKRTLVCARCLTEWEYLRVVCPNCREDRFDALSVYTADAFPHVRIDACDTCRRYLKTVDLTRNGLAVPLVDDIASVPLDLWAGEEGYRRLRANLLRTAEPALPVPSA